MRKFIARTRLRSFTTYYLAEWTIFDDDYCIVKFTEGPLDGKYKKEEVAIAQDEEWKLTDKEGE